MTVFKTGQADLVGGIGGTVDLQTTSPLSVDHRVVALDAFYNWTQFQQLTPGVKKAGESYTRTPRIPTRASSSRPGDTPRRPTATSCSAA